MEAGGLPGSTHWSKLTAIKDKSATEFSESWEFLYRLYRAPVFYYFKSKVRDEGLANELTQDFFAYVLEKDTFSRADPQKGKFRHFLRKVLRDFLCDYWDKIKAKKRGGDLPHVPPVDGLDSGGDTPEDFFTKQWKMALLNEAIKQVKASLESQGKHRVYGSFVMWLDGTPLEEIGKILGIELHSVKNNLTLCKKLIRERVESLISQQVTTPAEFSEELQVFKQK